MHIGGGTPRSQVLRFDSVDALIKIMRTHSVNGKHGRLQPYKLRFESLWVCQNNISQGGGWALEARCFRGSIPHGFAKIFSPLVDW